MDIPREKNQPSPITGRSSRDAVAPVRPAPVESPSPSDEDISIDDDIFESRAIPLSAKSRRSNAPKEGNPEAESPPPGPREGASRNPRKKPLERRTEPMPVNFKRTIRPRTALDADAALDGARAESAVPTERVDRDAMQFGKNRPAGASPDFRPNRLFNVLDETYKHSSVRWLDSLDRISMRFIIYSVIGLGLVGFAVIRYFGSMGAREIDTGLREAPVASTSDRIERAKTVVRAFLSAKTLEERLPLVLDPERAGPRMKQFYEVMGGQDPKLTGWEVGQPTAGDQGPWLPLVFKDEAGRQVTVVIGESETGYRVDWENFTTFGDSLWPEFVRARPSAPTAMRVRIRRIERYEGIYTKETWQSYEIEHRSGAPVLIGYAGRTGRSARDLGEAVKGNDWQCLQVYLRFDTAAGADNLVILDGIIDSRWQDAVTSWTGP